MYDREDKFLKYKTEGCARYITLNNPQGLNSIFVETINDLYPHFRALERNKEEKKLIIFNSAPGKVFCAGANVRRTMSAIMNKGDELGICDVGFENAYKMFYFIGNMNTPIVSVIDGVAMGAGIMIPMLTPFRVVTENTVVGMAEARIGSFVDASAAYVLPRLEKFIGTYMAMTGNSLRGEDLVFSGIATHFVKSSNITEMEKELSELQNPTHKNINIVLNKYAIPNTHKPQNYTLSGANLDTIERCFKYDTVEEILEALDKDRSKFALISKKQMLIASPTSLKLSLENHRRGGRQSFYKCMQTESHITPLIFRRAEFAEGVTATLVKKTKPKWSPSTIEEVDMEDIRRTFFTNINPLIVDRNDNDYHTIPYLTKYGLPSYAEIELSYARLGQNKQKTIDLLSSKFYNKFGIKEKVEEVVRQYQTDHVEISARL